MSYPSRLLHVTIARPWRDVYAFMVEPRNLPQWAAGLGGGVRELEGRWFVDTPAGPAELRFTTTNALGVLDHEVTTPEGRIVHVPLRVVPNGDGSEVVFTLFRLPGMGDDEFAADAARVQEDLQRLRTILESGPRGPGAVA